jgi:hypothetical protein
MRAPLIPGARLFKSAPSTLCKEQGKKPILISVHAGYGKELSNLGLQEFVNKKLVIVPNIPAEAH